MIAKPPRDSTRDPRKMPPDHAVEIENLAKTYAASAGQGPKRALDGVSLTVERGEIFGLLGPNGAGKTTLISILAGLARASSGTVSVLGHDVVADYAAARRKLGIVPQELVFDPFFSVREALRIQSGYFGVHGNDAWIDELLANRDQTWRLLQEYLLAERETFKLVDPDALPDTGVTRRCCPALKDNATVAFDLKVAVVSPFGEQVDTYPQVAHFAKWLRERGTINWVTISERGMRLDRLADNTFLGLLNRRFASATHPSLPRGSVRGTWRAARWLPLRRRSPDA
jgi:ABC-type Fe3+/spermidine/putrescine transport system ATPase subunit